MKQDQPTTERRRFLTLMGGGAVMLPFAGLVACSSEEPAAPTIAANSDDAPAARPSPATPSAETTTETASADVEQSTQQAAADSEQMAQNDASGGLPRLSEDDTQAKSLNYKHIASDVDSSKNPRYKEGQVCSNCQVYQGKDGDDWGPCAIFAGKAVKATGWCTAYAPMSA